MKNILTEISNQSGIFDIENKKDSKKVELLEYCEMLQKECLRLTSGNVAHLSRNIANGMNLIKLKIKKL